MFKLTVMKKSLFKIEVMKYSARGRSAERLLMEESDTLNTCGSTAVVVAVQARPAC